MLLLKWLKKHTSDKPMNQWTNVTRSATSGCFRILAVTQLAKLVKWRMSLVILGEFVAAKGEHHPAFSSCNNERRKGSQKESGKRNKH